MKKHWLACALISMSSLAGASESPYCAAVRGNGEAMPAHWGAIAKMMETYGAPSGMAGGSSASITSFFWESISMNPVVEQAPDNQKGQVEALLFKSLEGVTYHLYEKPEWKSLATWISKVKESADYKTLVSLTLTSDFKNELPKLSKALTDLKSSEIFYGPAVRAIAELASDKEILTNGIKRRVLAKRLYALKKTIDVFGKFDAKNDEQIFARDGLIDFGALARKLGAIGDFLNLRGATSKASEAFSDMISLCLPNSNGKTWGEILQTEPSCQKALASAFDEYFSTYKQTQQSRIFDEVGANRRVLITTSIVLGNSAENYRKSKSVQINSSDLRFGYWGADKDLSQIKSRFAQGSDPLSQLDKSKRFLRLPKSTWLQALSLSPAEPGLSSPLELRSVGIDVDMISFGGWSDLHPVPVLKAAGCERVIYVTRQGGDTLFGIGVTKRLLRFDKPEWSDLDRANANTVALNNNGLSDDQSSQWSLMYNLRNPKSSFAASLAVADAVVCTDWDSYDVKSQFRDLISTSYHSPILTPQDTNAVDPVKGFAPFAGCLPLR